MLGGWGSVAAGESAAAAQEMWLHSFPNFPLCLQLVTRLLGSELPAPPSSGRTGLSAEAQAP